VEVQIHWVKVGEKMTEEDNKLQTTGALVPYKSDKTQAITEYKVTQEPKRDSGFISKIFGGASSSSDPFEEERYKHYAEDEGIRPETARKMAKADVEQKGAKSKYDEIEKQNIRRKEEIANMVGERAKQRIPEEPDFIENIITSKKIQEKKEPEFIEEYEEIEESPNHMEKP